MNFCKAIPFMFDEYVLLSFSKNWIHLFKTVPEFEVNIDKENKLHLISTHTIKNKQQLRDHLQLHSTGEIKNRSGDAKDT